MKSENKYTLILLIVLIFLSMRNMDFAYYPSPSDKALTVQISMEDSWPEELERRICTPLENEIICLPEIKTLLSSCSRDECRITLILEDDAHTETTGNKLREIVDRLEPSFPSKASKAVIRRNSQSDTPVFIYVPELLSIGGSSRNWTEKSIRSSLDGIKGIAEIQISAASADEVHIQVDKERNESLNQSIINLAAEIGEQNSISSIYLKEGAVLALDHRLTGIDGFMNMPLEEGLSLGDVASIKEMSSPGGKRISKLNGKQQTTVWIYENAGAKTFELCRTLRQLADSQPDSLIIYDKGILVEEALYELFRILLFSMIAVILVTLLFLENKRAALPVCMNIPFSIAGTLALFNIFSWEIDILVLSTLALCTGMIIDSGIIVLEQGFKRSFPTLAASLLSTQLVLVPFLFAPVNILSLCLPLIKTLSICLSLSLVFIFLTMDHIEAPRHSPPRNENPRNVNPKNMSRRNKTHRNKSLLESYLSQKLNTFNIAFPSQALRKALFGLLLIFLMMSPVLLKDFKFIREFTLKSDSLPFSLEYPAGTPKEVIEEQLEHVEESLLNQEGIEYFSSDYRDGKASFNVRRTGELSENDCKTVLAEMMGYSSAYLHFDNNPVEDSYTLRISGNDRALLYSETRRIASRLQELLPQYNPVFHFKEHPPLILLKTKNHLFTAEETSPLQAALELDRQISKPVLGKWIPPNGTTHDIRIYDPEMKLSEASEISSLRLQNNKSVLGWLCDTEERINYGPLEHYNTARTLTISLTDSELNAKEIYRTINTALRLYELPEGIRISHGEDYLKSRKTQKELIKLLAASSVLLLILLMFIFESPFLPLFLTAQILFCHILTLTVLRLFHVDLSVPVFFALILNTGLSVNNGLIVYKNSSPRPSFEEARSGMLRNRKTLITAALTTLAGFIPFVTAGENTAELLKAVSLTVGSAVILSILILGVSVYLLKPADPDSRK
ncbi:MAG: efflux RND transporter permease subunit [Spirochaetales bacterium]|nr:efflux RND transporter permease subunit [Spirochaetales bacterium]